MSHRHGEAATLAILFLGCAVACVPAVPIGLAIAGQASAWWAVASAVFCAPPAVWLVLKALRMQSARLWGDK